MIRQFRSSLRILEHRILRPFWWRLVGAERARTMSNDAFRRLFPYPGSPDEWITEFHNRARLRFVFHPRNQKDFFLHLLTTTQSYEHILSEADDVLANRFQTLGSGMVELGWPINWQRDFKSGKEWPLDPSWELDILDLNNPSDVKIPWELSRFHQVWWLGKAYWLTRNEQYAEKFRDLVKDWIEHNPIGRGIHWHTAMEVAIRACNWMAGYYFFCESKSISSEFWLAFLRTLYVHGVFIRHHLEYARRNGNHLLSGLVGLVFLGTLFRDTRAGRAWLQRGLRALSEEIQTQVYPDGVSYEKSISYHRLVLELFSTAAILCQRNGIRFEKSFLQRLERMFEFVLQYTRPDGSAPLVGDADDGRLFRFSMNDDPNDHRHLLAVGAILFERDDFKLAAGHFSQDALWLFGGEGFEKYQLLREEAATAGSRSFPDGGFYTMRGDTAHLFVDAGDLGMRGRGGHGHNDTLSFEFWTNGEPLIVDSGTYAYTFDIEARQEFRSTRAHNTVMVDGREQAAFAGLWRVKEDRTEPRVLQWRVGEDVDQLTAEHHAYRPIVHRREFRFDKREPRLTIRDEILGEGAHTVESFLHFAPGLRLERETPQRVRVTSGRGSYSVEISTGTVEVIDTWFSPRYGVRQQNRTIRIVLQQILPVTITVTISPSR
jgi:uncharacterized heparinase superfamily protein